MIPSVQMISSLQGNLFFSSFNVKAHRETICNLLSEVLNQKIEYQNIPHNHLGRPDFSAWGLDANWTHSKNTCVLVYSFNCKVGIDLEFHKNRSLKIVNRFFHPDEIQAIEELQNKDNVLAQQLFYKLWCRKEAFFKCFGGSFFKDVLPQSMLNGNDSLFSFIEPSLGPLEEKSYSFCMVSSLEKRT